MNRRLRLWLALGIVAMLLAIAFPTYRYLMVKARESVLRQNLSAMREVIKTYTRDKNQAPQSLQDLVDAGYFRDTLPFDPMNAGWKPVVGVGGIKDVRS